MSNARQHQRSSGVIQTFLAFFIACFAFGACFAFLARDPFLTFFFPQSLDCSPQSRCATPMLHFIWTQYIFRKDCVVFLIVNSKRIIINLKHISVCIFLNNYSTFQATPLTFQVTLRGAVTPRLKNPFFRPRVNNSIRKPNSLKSFVQWHKLTQTDKKRRPVSLRAKITNFLHELWYRKQIMSNLIVLSGLYTNKVQRCHFSKQSSEEQGQRETDGQVREVS